MGETEAIKQIAEQVWSPLVITPGATIRLEKLVSPK
jgi:hypothetical protein